MARCDEWSSVAGVPNTRTVPPSGPLFGLSSPVMSRTDVVLPHPLGPISPRIVPRSSRRSSDLTTSRSSKLLVSDSATTSGPAPTMSPTRGGGSI